MFEVNPQDGPAIIEIEIAIEIGNLPGLDFDHDFDFDTDSELPRFENKLALGVRRTSLGILVQEEYPSRFGVARTPRNSYGHPIQDFKKASNLMTASTSRHLTDMFDAMLAHLGPSGWWPARSPFEVAVGAILTQNTNWSNVEKAIANLHRSGLLDPEQLRLARPEVVEECIRPSGFFRQKAKKIQNFLDFLDQEQALDLKSLALLDTAELRARLLEVKGIGPETADSILLYALDRPVFVVDAYTARICNRHGLVPEDVAYDELQDLFMSHLPKQVGHYNEYHALLVRVGKQWCRKREPRCVGCPLQPYLPYHSAPHTP